MDDTDKLKGEQRTRCLNDLNCANYSKDNNIGDDSSKRSGSNGVCIACSTYEPASESSTDSVGGKNMAKHKKGAEFVSCLDYGESAYCTQNLNHWDSANCTTCTHCLNSGDRMLIIRARTVKKGAGNNDCVANVLKIGHRGENSGVKRMKKTKDNVVIYFTVCSAYQD